MVRIIQTSLNDFLGHHQGKIGRLCADILNGFSALMINFTSRIALDPLGLGRQPLLIFFHKPLRPFFRRCQNSFGFLRRRGQLGFVLFEFAFRL